MKLPTGQISARERRRFVRELVKAIEAAEFCWCEISREMTEGYSGSGRWHTMEPTGAISVNVRLAGARVKPRRKRAKL